MNKQQTSTSKSAYIQTDEDDRALTDGETNGSITGPLSDDFAGDSY